MSVFDLCFDPSISDAGDPNALVEPAEASGSGADHHGGEGSGYGDLTDATVGSIRRVFVLHHTAVWYPDLFAVVSELGRQAVYAYTTLDAAHRQDLDGHETLRVCVGVVYERECC